MSSTSFRNRGAKGPSILCQSASQPAAARHRVQRGDLAIDLNSILCAIRACRVCRDAPHGAPLPHEPRPVVRAAGSARVLIIGQAPGARVHASGLPFDDPSGVRLRAWMAIERDTFYDASRIAFAPMGFCFPGQSAKGTDLPPRRECAPLWQERLALSLTNVRLVLLVGSYAQRWHLGSQASGGLTQTVRRFEEILAVSDPRRVFPLPHPSWRNNSWLAANTWFEAEALPRLRQELVRALT